ncbi:MAG: L-threonine dehydratase catabolic TdcB [Verrucomicrobiota bacterium]|jgi:threonine dehydratase
MVLDLATIRAAHACIRPYIIRTPVLTNPELDAASGAQLFFKCENLQKAGAFKARGATHAVFSLDPGDAARGVATHSSGNHAAALARAARLRGIPAHIVMPTNSARPKIRAVEGYGGQITFCEPTQSARETTCARIIAETHATMVHPFENKHVIAGQGTATLEFLEDISELDLLLCPVGGGGLLAGTAIAGKALRPSLQIIGTEPAGADDAARSFRAGTRLPLTTVDTIADGLRTNIGEINFAIAQTHVDQIVTVSEAAIIEAMRLLWESLRVIVEASSAVPYAAILEKKVAVAGRRVGIILSGGNVDLDTLPWLPSTP